MIATRENRGYSLCVSCAHEINRQLQSQVPALGRECPGRSGGCADETAAFPQPEIFVARGNERLETVGPPAVGRIRASV